MNILYQITAVLCVLAILSAPIEVISAVEKQTQSKELIQGSKEIVEFLKQLTKKERRDKRMKEYGKELEEAVKNALEVPKNTTYSKSECDEIIKPGFTDYLMYEHCLPKSKQEEQFWAWIRIRDTSTCNNEAVLRQVQLVKAKRITVFWLNDELDIEEPLCAVFRQIWGY